MRCELVTGDIKALEHCTQLTKVDMQKTNVEGGIEVLKNCPQLTYVDMSETKVQGTMELSSSSCGPVRFS